MRGLSNVAHVKRRCSARWGRERSSNKHAALTADRRRPAAQQWPAQRARLCASVAAQSIQASDVAAPADAYEKASDLGAFKAHLHIHQIVILGCLGGFYIGFGSLLMLCCGASSPGLAETNPGIAGMISGIFGFPSAVLIGIISGAEVSTANTAIVAAATLEGKTTVREFIKSWTVSWVGNLVGSVALAWLAVQAGVLGSDGPAAALSVSKTGAAFTQRFVSGILANWLVCLSTWMAAATSSMAGKAIAVLAPTSMFVAIGLEHSVANMFFIPAGIFAGSGVTWGAFLSNNLLPTTLGNAIGGAVFVALAYAIAFGKLGKHALRL